MFETPITIVGNIVTDPNAAESATRRSSSSGWPAIRVDAPPRGTWEPGNSLFVTVNCWGKLVTGVGAALAKGDPVIVVGHVYTSEYEDRDGNRRSSVEVRATSVGPDLARCIARIDPSQTEPADEDAAHRSRRRSRRPPRRMTTTDETSPARALPLTAYAHRHSVGSVADVATPTMVRGQPQRLAISSERQHHGMAEFIYSMRKVRKAHGDKVILDDVSLNFLPGAKIGVVGPNGAGKSSVLRIMAGLDTPNNGDALLQPGATVGILQQEPQLDETKTVRENVEDGVAIKAKLNRYNEVAELMATDYTDELMEEMGKLQEELDAADAWDIDSQLEQAMDALRCPPPDDPVTNLSGGERRRVALCKLLLSKPDLLLLDEPTNHLDAESVLWLEQHLAEYKGAILAVTHDRYFLDNVAEWILELDRGRAYPYEGNYSTYLEKKAERVAIQGRKDAKLHKRLQEELAWVRSGAKARQAKNKARLGRYEEMAAEAEKTRKLDFEEIQIPIGPRLGSIVVEVEHLDKGFEGRHLIKDLSFTLPRNGIVGVIGPNGVGKTTLFKTIVGSRAAGQRHREGRRDGQAELRRPEPWRHRPQENGLGGRLRRAGLHRGRPERGAVAGLRVGVRVQGSRPAETGGRAVRR